MATESYAAPVADRRSLSQLKTHHYYIPASHQAYRILYVGFILAPLLAGVDKFTNLMIDWTVYLSPLATAQTGLTAHQFMMAAGVVEIVAAALVAFKPRIGGLIVAVWLWGIIANLLSIPGFYDIALRDFGLSLGALALSRLAVEFDSYRPTR